MKIWDLELHAGVNPGSTGCVTLHKLQASLSFTFLFCKIGTIRALPGARSPQCSPGHRSNHSLSGDRNVSASSSLLPSAVCLLPRPSPPLSVILKISDRVLLSQKLQRPSIALTNKQVVIEWVGLELEQ